MKKFTCSICGKEFNDVALYVSHVSKCAEEYKKKEAEDLQKLNEDLNRVKSAKAYYESQLEMFKENHPDAYKLNFGEKTEVKTGKSPAAGKRPSNMVKETSTETIEDLMNDPFVDYLLHVLDLAD